MSFKPHVASVRMWECKIDQIFDFQQCFDYLVHAMMHNLLAHIIAN